MNNDELQAATDKLEFPRVTKEYLEKKIVNKEFYVWPNSTVTVCKITLDNGFSVLGESACVDPRNFSNVIGEGYAYGNAFDQLWKLEGYMLAERMFRENATDNVFVPMLKALYVAAGREVPPMIDVDIEIPALIEGIRGAS